MSKEKFKKIRDLSCTILKIFVDSSYSRAKLVMCFLQSGPAGYAN